ncbi:MAG: pyridoxamine 5'-phosphate oxidase family protein [Cardiobacteriaceae bacterium]|nr:pyridoxamine 5'-phosphate oxidase family protein [Cardiobacteriaceae bacterium]
MKKIRRADRLLDDAQALDIIDRADYAVVSCNDDVGGIFSIPLSIARNNRSIYIHGARSGSKQRLYLDGRVLKIVCVSENKTPELSDDDFLAISDNPHALANRIFTTKYESTICTAKVYLVEDLAEKRLGLKLLCEKYCKKYMSGFDITADEYINKMNIWRFDIVEMMAKSNK